MDITGLKGWEMKDNLLNKKISCRQLIEAHINKIEEVEPSINAFITLDKMAALEKADIIDQKD